jgi:hypothetical protein
MTDGKGRCGERHPMYGRQVRCEERRNHAGDHFNSFYMRAWDNTRRQPEQVRPEAVAYGGAA